VPEKTRFYAFNKIATHSSNEISASEYYGVPFLAIRKCFEKLIFTTAIAP
jgi:hypothetical protein